MTSPHSHRLRLNRWSESDRIYLITTTTHRRHPWFANLHHGRLLVASLRFADARGWTTTWAFVVMPDHLHWLVALGDRIALSEVVGRVKSYSARRLITASGIEDRVWQPGFHDHALRREEDLAATARYVIANPVRAGLVRSVGDYPLWDARWL